VAEHDKAVYRIVIAGSMEAIFRELTKTDAPQGAVFNSVLTLPAPGLTAGKKMQMRTVGGGHALVVGEVVESIRRDDSRTPIASRNTTIRSAASSTT
jgi:hypothetical protein